LLSLERRATEIGAIIAHASLGRVPAPPDANASQATLPALSAQGAKHVRLFVNCARERRAPDENELSFVRDVGIRRARELVPFSALTERARAGRRALWEVIVKEGGTALEGQAAVMELAKWMWVYADAVASTLESGYVGQLGLLARSADLARREFFEDTVSGRFFSRQDAPELAAGIGLAPEADYVVLAVSPADRPQKPAIDALAADLETNLAKNGRPPFVVARSTEVIVVISCPTTAEAKHIWRVIRPPRRALATGVDGPCRGLGEVPIACEGAMLALRHARRIGGVVGLDDVKVFDHLLTNADSTARRMSGKVASRVLVEDRRRPAELVNTLATYVECDMNVIRTAEALSLHPNSIRNRLTKINQLTGLDPRRIRDVMELAVVVGLGREELS
jgi:PucR-like helix-turn-helix protein/diguanylate cyclase with GGDEF domain